MEWCCQCMLRWKERHAEMERNSLPRHSKQAKSCTPFSTLTESGFCRQGVHGNPSTGSHSSTSFQVDFLISTDSTFLSKPLPVTRGTPAEQSTRVSSNIYTAMACQEVRRQDLRGGGRKLLQCTSPPCPSLLFPKNTSTPQFTLKIKAKVSSFANC
jgi:hypothetical protein